MIYRLIPHNNRTRKLLCLTVILIFSLGIFPVNAMADGCPGDAGCQHCDTTAAHHAPDIKISFKDNVCGPESPNSSCGLDNGQIPYRPTVFVSSIRGNGPDNSSFTDTASLEPVSDQFANSFTLPIHDHHFSGQPPIYLLNSLLLC
jgi:hypothetical protein